MMLYFESVTRLCILDLTNLTAAPFARKTDTRGVGFVVRNCLEA